MNKARVLIRGGGDLASGVAARLHRIGFAVMITELPGPLVVRRTVSFAEAVFSGSIQVEDITGRLADRFEQVAGILDSDEVAVIVDPDLAYLNDFSPLVLVDARMRKRPPETGLDAAPLVIGLGPGFTAGEDCHAVIETMRGHLLGRVIWEGPPLPDTGEPDIVLGIGAERVLRAPADGLLETFIEIGDLVESGEPIARVKDETIIAPFDGVLRGLVHDGLVARVGMKVGDLDPRGDPVYATLISDKSLAIGGGVVEAVLSQESIRRQLYALD
jgi:xanthine dehydrogenase accessory factor